MNTKKAKSNRKSKPHTPRFTGRNPSRECLEPIADWEAEVSVARDGKKNLTYRRKVQTHDIIRIEVGDPLATIAETIFSGYEVRLVDCEGNDAIRLFPCLDAKYEKMFVAAQTMGNFRKYIENVPFHMEHCGEIVNPEEEFAAKEKIKAEREKHRRLSVTPDTMVTCPNCGTEFRVGRKLEEN